MTKKNTGRYALCRNRRERLLCRLGWEPAITSRLQGIRTWVRPHPNDVASYTTPKALWIALTGRSRRGGWKAGWRLWQEGR